MSPEEPAPWSTVLKFLSKSKNNLQCVEPKGSVMCSQEPAICPFSESDKYISNLIIYYKIYFNIIFPFTPRFFQVSFHHLISSSQE